MVLNKSMDLIYQTESGEFIKYRKASKDIKDLKVQWNDKMKILQDQDYSTQELKNFDQEQIKLKDLEYLKSTTPQGPFTQKQEECKQLYIEVRYARMTSNTANTCISVSIAC